MKLNTYSLNNFMNIEELKSKLNTQYLKSHNFTEAELVEFGNYLLSDERNNRFLNNQGYDKRDLEELKKQVWDADLANWKYDMFLKSQSKKTLQ